MSPVSFLHSPAARSVSVFAASPESVLPRATKGIYRILAPSQAEGHVIRDKSFIYRIYAKSPANPFVYRIYENRRVCGVRTSDFQRFGIAHKPFHNSFPCHTYRSADYKSFHCHTSEKTGVPPNFMIGDNNNDHANGASASAQDATRLGRRRDSVPTPCRLATARFPRAFALSFPAPGSSRRSMSLPRTVRTTKKFASALALPPAKETSAIPAG